MRNFKLQVQTTADGFMGGLTGELDWMTYQWSDDLNEYMDGLTKQVDTIIMGRKLAEGFIPHWASRPESETKETVDWMNNTPKVVLSRTLRESPWPNATVENDLVATVNRLKGGSGGDLIAYGGREIVSSLIGRGLLDDLHLFVNPVAIGQGLPVFPEDSRQNLKLVDARTFDCGIAMLHFQPNRA